MTIFPCSDRPPNDQIPITFLNNISAILYAPTKKWDGIAHIQFPDKAPMPCTILTKGEPGQISNWTLDKVLKLELIGQVACVNAEGIRCFKHLRICIPKGRLTLYSVRSYEQGECWFESDLISELRSRAQNLPHFTAMKVRDLMGKKRIAIQTAAGIEILSFYKFSQPPATLGGENHIHKHTLYQHEMPQEIIVRFAIKSELRSLTHRRNRNRKKIYELLQGHPHCTIPRIIEYNTLRTNRTKFIEIMPLFPHGDVERNLIAIQKDKIVSMAKQMASAVFLLHERNLVHRDIKLSNFLMDQDHIFLHDFDMAAIIDPNEPSFSIHFCGTACYTSPELLLQFFQEGRYCIKPTDDLWALGLCLYRLQYKESPPFFPNLDEVQKTKEVLSCLCKCYAGNQHAAWWQQEYSRLNEAPSQDKMLTQLTLDLLHPDANLRFNAKTTLERLHVSI